MYQLRLVRWLSEVRRVSVSVRLLGSVVSIRVSVGQYGGDFFSFTVNLCFLIFFNQACFMPMQCAVLAVH